ncbi:MAG: hypothetical protein FWB71_03935, partial [Defluviitaleaceae bacterium]|nr:hypothetical protein [Defluviitaleaceae bacterium]
KYENMRDRPPAAHARAYADHLASFLDSGILDAPDARRYSYLYLNLMALVEDADFFNNDDFAKIVDCALFVGDYILAENWAKKSAQTASEQGYLNLLKVYYATNRSRQFFDTLSALKKSDLPLSPEGLELVQFFT